MRELAIALVLASVALPSAAAAGVTVRFVSPERYMEREYGVTGTRRGALAEMQRHIERLGAHYLRPGQDLTVEVLDLDFAGEQRPWSPQPEVRVFSGVTWPRIALRYTLREKGRPARSGEEVLRDRMYLWNYAARNSSDPLRFEKALLNDWFQRRFAQPGR